MYISTFSYENKFIGGGYTSIPWNPYTKE